MNESLVESLKRPALEFLVELCGRRCTTSNYLGKQTFPEAQKNKTRPAQVKIVKFGHQVFPRCLGLPFWLPSSVGLELASSSASSHNMDLSLPGSNKNSTIFFFSIFCSNHVTLFQICTDHRDWLTSLNLEINFYSTKILHFALCTILKCIILHL